MLTSAPLLLQQGIFNLELSWRGLDGSFHNKLGWAQILAERSNVTLAIEDSTLATGSASQAGDDLEGNYIMDQALILQKDVYLHIDVFRMDQVIRNMITNAVCTYVHFSYE